MRFLTIAAVLTAFAGCNESVSVTKNSPPTVETLDRNLPGPDSMHRASDPAGPLDQPKYPTDEAITDEIRQKLMVKENASSFENIRVSTEDGNVKLLGLVKSAEEKIKAEEIAKTATGAKSVDSKIEVE